jgi:hypothetical protein
MLISRNPFPLHEFSPLQLLRAVLQALCPLHELTPVHLPQLLPAETIIGAVANRVAAAIARAAPVTFRLLVILRLSSHSVITWSDLTS